MIEKINDNITLVGTAHISESSVEEVKKTIENEKPDVVAVELCEQRYKALTEKKKWENTSISELLKSNKAFLMLAQIFLSSIQRKLGKEHGVEPGSEMVAAIESADEYSLGILLADRDITITLKRAWRKMGFLEKIRLVWELLKALVGFEEEEIEELDLEEIMQEDVITSMMEEFSRIAPSVSQVLITERDQYLAKKIREKAEEGKKVVAVIGAGHVKGVKKQLRQVDDTTNLSELEHIPKKRFHFLKHIGYIIPVAFAAIIIYIFITGSWERAANALLWWFLINGALSAVGTIIARAHPASIATAFLAAPITSLNPAVAAGWIAGYVEYKFHKPRVKDFKSLSKIENMTEFFQNKVIKLLLVVSLANLGSMIGTFIALPYILSLGFT
ncbi:MAG: TraB/GumN family protein [Candidatus Thermoplasmatota archaeon]